MNGKHLNVGIPSLWVSLLAAVVLLAVVSTVTTATATATTAVATPVEELPETGGNRNGNCNIDGDDDNGDPGTCESPTSTSSSSSSSFQGSDSIHNFSLKDFLETAVFGQQHDDSSDPQENKERTNPWPKPPSLAYLEHRQKKNEKTNNADEDVVDDSSHLFFSLLDGVKQIRASILGFGDDLLSDSQNNNEGTTETSTATTNEIILARVLERTKVLTQKQEDTSVGMRDFMECMRSALMKVAQQLQDNFGELLATNIDAFIVLAIPYFAMARDAENSPLWKRKLHRFYPKVTKDEWIDLHDALYLSHLAYVNTIKEFETGLEAFQEGAWKKLYGTTQSLPDLPASFLLIHKELDPLENNNNNNNKQPNQILPFQTPLDVLQEVLRKPPPQTEVLVTLVIRGSKDLPDFLNDGLLEPEEYRGGYAHHGILASGKNLVQQYLPILKELHTITSKSSRFCL